MLLKNNILFKWILCNGVSISFCTIEVKININVFWHLYGVPKDFA